VDASERSTQLSDSELRKTDGAAWHSRRKTTMKPKATEELEQEHRIIERVLAAMVVLAEKLHSGKEIQATVSGEHRKVHSLVADLQQTSQAYLQAPDTDKEALIATLHRLVELYPAHISKEDYLLFSMTDKILSDTNKRPYHRGSNDMSLQSVLMFTRFRTVGGENCGEDPRRREYGDRSASCIDSYWRGQFEPVARAIK
jgi:cell division protein FtsB